ncbi:MAG: sigma-70 family RNA polymerase sigma factor [Anaerolineales bacterium]|jgi:RNA polymerase sigma-70 factor (ECF subfamily)
MHIDIPVKGSFWDRELPLFGIELDDTLKRARNLDADALAQIHDQYYPVIYRYVRYRLDNEQVCEDITSEVFLRLLDALHQKRGPNQSLRGWLFGTASNLVNDHLRRYYARPVEELKEYSENMQYADPHSPEQFMDDSFQRQEVKRALQQLTNEQQHVLALRFAEQRSLDETAKIIGKSVSAIKALQFRALASLRRRLGE